MAAAAIASCCPACIGSLSEKRRKSSGDDCGQNLGALVAENCRCGNAEAPAPEQFPAQQAGALPAIGADVQQRLSSAHAQAYSTTMRLSRVQRSWPFQPCVHRAYLTTMLMSLPGTTTTLTTCLPAIAACTLASASAALLHVLASGVGQKPNHGAQLAVDLHRDFELLFPGQIRIEAWPRLAQ